MKEKRQVWIIIVCLTILHSCNIRNEKMSPEFNEYASKFEKSNEGFEIDSALLVTYKNKFNKQPSDIIKKLDFFQIKEYQEKCGEFSKYDIYPYKLVNYEGFIVLIHYLKLNPNCTSEAYDNKFILAQYDLQGNMLNNKKIAELVEMWEYEKYIYCKLVEKQLNLQSVEFKHDYEANTSEVIRNSESFTLSKAGLNEIK